MSSRIDVRVEDLLAGTFAVALAAFVAIRSSTSDLRLDETNWWDFSFILAPVSILVFANAVRFAWAGDATGRPSTVAAVGTTIRDWLPFLVFSLAHQSFRTGIWELIHVEDRDAELLLLDRRLFGENAVRSSCEGPPAPASRTRRRPRSSSTSSSRPSSPILLYRRRRPLFRGVPSRRPSHRVIGSIGYIVVPATGNPEVAFPPPLVQLAPRRPLPIPATRFIERRARPPARLPESSRRHLVSSTSGTASGAAGRRASRSCLSSSGTGSRPCTFATTTSSTSSQAGSRRLWPPRSRAGSSALKPASGREARGFPLYHRRARRARHPRS